MLALAMSAGVSAENAANGAVGNANGKTAESKYVPTEGNLAARARFQDAKFGIFLHWGLYSMLATGEWTMTNKDLNYKEYAKLAGGFYPSKFNAREWVSAIKASGAKYICFTTRHHEGFSMFHTKYSDYNIVDASPFKRDIVKELADECHRQGIGLHFYYSHIDWGREDAPLGRTGLGTGRPKEAQNWDSYYKFMNNQLTELLTNYGEVNAICRSTGAFLSSMRLSISCNLLALSAITTTLSRSTARTSRCSSATCLARTPQACRVRLSASCRLRPARQ